MDKTKNKFRWINFKGEKIMKSKFMQVFNRFKNVKVLIAVISGILLILVNTGIIDSVHSEKIMNTVNTVLSALVALGILSNPDSHIED